METRTDALTESLPLQVLRGPLAGLAAGGENSTAGVSRGAKVHRRTEAQASMVAPPLAHMRLSNHRSLRMERPRFHTD